MLSDHADDDLQKTGEDGIKQSVIGEEMSSPEM